jgi:hypothetical protein
MKKWLLILVVGFSLSSCDVLYQVMNETDKIGTGQYPTNKEAIEGLKQALEIGVDRGSSLLSATDGFLKSQLYKILIPEDVQKAADFLRDRQLGFLVDNSIEAMNRGAELASKEAKDIFVAAIRDMTIQEALSVLTGGDGAATDYLQQSSTYQLRQKYGPIIQKSLDEVGATKNWESLTKTFNDLSIIHGKPKINTDLNAYVTDKAMEALFDTIRKEENKIRANPLERTTDILVKVFAYADSQKNP